MVDGTGNPWFKADVGIEEGKITAMGDLSSIGAERIIDASGLIVCPGFIDIHNHSDISVLAYPKCDSMIMQGVTTQVVGNCGASAAPIIDLKNQSVRALPGVKIDWRTFDEYLKKVEKQGVSTNIASLVGHSTIRKEVMG